jgi:hypothetical protein
MIFTSFKPLQQFFWKKNTAVELFAPGQHDPHPLTRGPEAHSQATLARSTGSKIQPDHPSLAPVTGGDQEEAALGCGKRRGKGSCRTGFSPGTCRGGQLGRRRAGGGRFCGGELGTCEVNGDGGGDSGHLGPIPSTGRKREARRSFSARRRRLGRRGTAASSSGHGGTLGCLWGVPGRESREARKREGKRGRCGVAACLQGRSSTSRAASRRCRRFGPAQDTQVLEVEDKGIFFRKPLALEGFPGKKKHPFVLFDDSNYSKVFKINMDFLTYRSSIILFANFVNHFESISNKENCTDLGFQI